MKQLLSMAALFLAAITAKAQLDFSGIQAELAGDYTQYLGDFRQSTPGARLRLSVPLGDRMRLGLGYTHGFPIKVASAVSLSPSGSAPSEFVYNFKTITIDGSYFFGEEKFDGFSMYGTLGAGLVLVSYQEKLKGSVPSGFTVLDQAPKESVNGFTLNFGLGAQYSFGKPRAFLEGGYALPANRVNNSFVENPIPAHFSVNLGVRFLLGSGSDSDD